MAHPPDPEPSDRRSAGAPSADDARRRLRERGIVAIEPDERIGMMLGPEEHVVAVRRAVTVERRTEVRDPELGLRGDLYVTTSRLVCLGVIPVEIPIATIREADVVTGALRLIVGDGRGIEIRTTEAEVLRVEIAAVRSAARAAATPDEAAPIAGPPSASGS